MGRGQADGQRVPLGSAVSAPPRVDVVLEGRPIERGRALAEIKLRVGGGYQEPVRRLTDADGRTYLLVDKLALPLDELAGREECGCDIDRLRQKRTSPEHCTHVDIARAVSEDGALHGEPEGLTWRTEIAGPGVLVQTATETVARDGLEARELLRITAIRLDPGLGRARVIVDGPMRGAHGELKQLQSAEQRHGGCAACYVDAAGAACLHARALAHLDPEGSLLADVERALRGGEATLSTEPDDKPGALPVTVFSWPTRPQLRVTLGRHQLGHWYIAYSWNGHRLALANLGIGNEPDRACGDCDRPESCPDGRVASAMVGQQRRPQDREAVQPGARG